jgi:hypothetical protein
MIRIKFLRDFFGSGERFVDELRIDVLISLALRERKGRDGRENSSNLLE